MSKLIVIPSSQNLVKDIINDVDGFILGLNSLSVNMPFYFEDEELFNTIEYLNDSNKEIFINLNKNMHTSDLDYLKEILIKLNKYNVIVMYYDIAIPNLREELGLKYDLVWAQEHLTTNSSTINFWYNHGAHYTLLSNEITKNEIIKIKDSVKSKLMLNLFGYVPIFTSKRRLVKNYLETFNIKNDSNEFKIFKEGKYYPIVCDKLGTTVYNNNILNGIKEYLELDLDYTVLNSYKIDNNDFIEVIRMFKDCNKDNVEVYFNKIKDKFENSDTLFLYRETMYKVK